MSMVGGKQLLPDTNPRTHTAPGKRKSNCKQHFFVWEDFLPPAASIIPPSPLKPPTFCSKYIPAFSASPAWKNAQGYMGISANGQGNFWAFRSHTKPPPPENVNGDGRTEELDAWVLNFSTPNFGRSQFFPGLKRSSLIKHTHT